MRGSPSCDEELIRRLPLPLAQLYRRAHNAKTPLEQHQAAYYLWEAVLKLLGSVAIAAYAEREHHDPQLTECLTNLTRPALGHWWEFVRRLVPILAEGNEAGFVPVRDLVLGRTRDDLPRTAGLDAALTEVLDGRSGARATVRLSELFDRLVRYRNLEVGHGAIGQRPTEHYERLGQALLLAMAELLHRWDVLAGGRLLYVGEVRQVGGVWLVQRYELIGESPRRIASLELPRSEASRVPDGERVYWTLVTDGKVEADTATAAPLRSLHPLLIYEAEAEEVLFLNSRRGHKRTEYLGYSTGRTVDRPDLGGEQRALLTRVLGMEVAEGQAEQWAARSQGEESAEPVLAGSVRRTLGEFELISELGRGGMGVVYRAWQPSLGRQVALKKLLATGDDRTEARFRREIRALGQVEHPHLVKIFTSGSDGDQWFYAMELVEGAPLSAVCDRLRASSSSVTDVDARIWRETVSQVCQEARDKEKTFGDSAAPVPLNRPPVSDRPTIQVGRGYAAQVVELVRQAAEAAHALHEAGIIHRDIKPGNIMVSANSNQAVLMDLGLAQVADDEEGRLTRMRQFVGTMRYASPEQVLAAGRLDRRSDVYSLGATLWELLTLRPLYGATEQTPTPALMQRIPVEEPGRVRKYNPTVPRDLEAVVEKCLQKDARRRYGTARELGEELARFLEGRPVKARRVSGLERGLKWARRRPALAALVTVLVLGTVGLLIGWAWFTVELDNARTKANMHAESERKQREVADEKREDADKARKDADTQKGLAQKRAEDLKDALGKVQNAERKVREDAAQLAFIVGKAADNAWDAGKVAHARELLQEFPLDFRGWEWRCRQRRFQGSYLTLYGHTSSVTSVAFSPDGLRLASGSYDETVRLWDARTGTEVLTLRGHAASVTSVAFSPDGVRLASASLDNTVILWDARTGQALRTLRGHTREVTCVAFSPDGHRLASASEKKGKQGKPGEVKVWDAHSGQELLTLLIGKVTSVAFSPDGQRLACGDQDGNVKLRNADTGAELSVLCGHTSDVTSLAFSPDGQRLATGSHDRTVKLWDARTGATLLTLHAHSEWVTSVVFSPDGQRLATGSWDNTVKLWDARTGATLLTLYGHTSSVTSVAFSPDGQRLATGSEDTTVRLWDGRTGSEWLTLHDHTKPVTSVAFSPDGHRLASGSDDQTVKLWDTRTGQELSTLRGHIGDVTGVAFSRDGRRLASASEDRTVKLWDSRTGAELLTLNNYVGPVICVAFSLDGQFLACGDQDGKVKLYDGSFGRKRRTLSGHTRKVTGVAFSPDGQRLASASEDRTVKLWDARTGQELLALRGHTASVTSVAFSADGLRLASASKDRMMKVWDACTGTELFTLCGHAEPVTGVTFSPDGQRLASASYDQTVRLWDARAGTELVTLRGHTASVTSVAFSADGLRLASASGDDTMKLWDARTGQELLALRGHTASVTSVAFSPDGLRLASAGADNTVKLWDARTGRALLTLRGHAGRVTGVAFSPDGRRLASASADNTVKLWDARTGKEVLPFRLLHYPVGVTSVAFSPDGQRLAYGDQDGNVKLRNADTGAELFVLRGHTKDVTSVAVSPDGQRLASGSYDQTVKLWDTRTGQELSTLRGHTGHVTGVAFSRDGRRLASASEDRTVKLWDSRTGAELLTLRSDAGLFTSVAFSPDGRRLASGSHAQRVQLWDARTGQELLTLRCHAGWDVSVAFGPDGQRLACGGGRRLPSGDYDGVVTLLDGRTTKELLTLRGHAEQVYSIAFSPDGLRLASGSMDGAVKLWDARTGQELFTVRGHGTAVFSVAFSPDGQRLASGSGDHTVRVWDARIGQELLTLRGHAKAVARVAFSPDGLRLVSRDSSGTLRAWSAKTGDSLPPPQQVVFAHPWAVQHPSRPILAVAQSKQIVLIDVSPPDEIEFAYRDAMARFDSNWQRDQAQRQKKSQNWFAAAFHWGQLVEHDPGRLSNWSELETACANLRDWRPALAVCDRLLKWDGTLAPIYYRRSRLRAHRLEFHEAIADLLAGLVLVARHPVGWPQLADSAREEGNHHANEDDWAQAIPAFADAAAWEPQEAEHLHRLAWAYLAAGKEEAARSVCRRLFDRYRKVTDVETHYRLAAEVGLGLAPGPSLLRGLGRPVADELLQKMQRSRNRAIVVTASLVPGHGLPAGDLVQMAQQDVAAERSAASLAILGAAQYRAGQYGEAITNLEEAVKLFGEGGNTWMRLFLALAYQQQKQPDQARVWLKRVQPGPREAFIHPGLKKARVIGDSDWEEQVIKERLRAEADRLIKGK